LRRLTLAATLKEISHHVCVVTLEILRNLLIIMLVLFISCNDCLICDHAWKFNLENNSNVDIAVLYQLNYPDTLLLTPKPVAEIIKARTTGYIERPGKLEQEMEHNEFGVMTIFMIEKNKFMDEPWDSIVKYYEILDRYEFTYSQLKTENYTIKYSH
jgi:hypothetical protein